MKNTTLFIGILGLIAVGSLLYYVNINSPVLTDNTMSTTTPISIKNPSVTTTTTTTIREAGAPIPVTSPNVTTSEFAASVTGTVVPHGFFTNYWFEYGITQNLGSKTVVQNIGSGYNALTSPAYITGLNKNTTYYYRLVSENQYGKVAGIQYTFTTDAGNPSPIGSLPTVKTFTSNEISRTSATLQGEVTPNQVNTQYWFEYGRTSNFGYTTSLQTITGSNGKTSVSLPITNLEPLTNYYFRINAQNSWGTVTGTTFTFKTSGPSDTAKPLVDTLDANTLKTTSATLRGTVNPNGMQTIYWFEYSTDSLLGATLLKTTTHMSAGVGTNDIPLSSNISSLVSNTNYFYRIVAENSLGVSYGDRVSFKTK